MEMLDHDKPTSVGVLDESSRAEMLDMMRFLKTESASLRITLNGIHEQIVKMRERTKKQDDQIAALERRTAAIARSTAALRSEVTSHKEQIEELQAAAVGDPAALRQIRLRCLLDAGLQRVLDALGFETVLDLKMQFSNDDDAIARLVKVLKEQSRDCRARELANPEVIKKLVWS